MAIDKAKLVEKMKSATPEERALFREALLEVEPQENSEILSGEEILSVREILASFKQKKEKKKPKGFLDAIDEIFGIGREE
jgi:hypothetical protein